MTEYRSADLLKAIFGPRIKCWSNAASTPQQFAMIKQKSENEHIEQSILNLKRP